MRIRSRCSVLHLDAFRYIVNSQSKYRPRKGRGDDHASSTVHTRRARPAWLRPLAAALRTMGRAVRAWWPRLRPWVRPPSPWWPRPARQRPRRHPALLAERPMHGYEMIQELTDRTGGVWRPSPGSVYPALQMQLVSTWIIS